MIPMMNIILHCF